MFDSTEGVDQLRAAVGPLGEEPVLGELPGVFALPRMLRHFGATGEHMPPDGAVEVDAPDSALRAALSAARSGGWEPAADLMARTRDDRDWERRGRYCAGLADLALHHTGWLDDWRRERPGDPGLALVAAELEIGRAWEIRTAARARHVSRERFQAFHAVLLDAEPVLRTAADLNPGDPVPWRILIAHAMGLAAPRPVFDAYLARGREADPHHLGLHARAVQYLAQKWYGSHEEMFGFAESAAAAAPEGSPLRGLPLHAVTEYALEHKAGSRRGPVARSRIEGHVEAGLRLSAAYAPGDRRASDPRNHLALALIRSGRQAEALEVFRLIGTDARAFPWAYLGDPREIFLLMRRGVRVHVARRTPYFGGTVPAPAFGDVTGAAASAGAAAGPADPSGPAEGPAEGAVEGPAEGAVEGPAAGAMQPAAMAVALAGAPLRDVREAILITGTTMRLAPARRGGTFVEIAPSADPPGRRKGLRGTLLGEGGLPGLAGTFSRGEKWPVLVAVKEGADYTLHLYRDGRLVTAHAWWADPAEMPTQEEAAERATALAAAYGTSDPRPLTAILRGTGDPRRHLDEAFAALGLPSPPAGFGRRPEPLAEVPGARLVERRSFFRAIKESLSSEGVGTSGGELPPLS